MTILSCSCPVLCYRILSCAEDAFHQSSVEEFGRGKGKLPEVPGKDNGRERLEQQKRKLLFGVGQSSFEERRQWRIIRFSLSPHFTISCRFYSIHTPSEVPRDAV